MEKKMSGGPAFPVPGLQQHEEFNGMSLRDYFAAEAMQSLISNSNGRLGVGYEEANQRYAKAAYSIADAMLAERAK